MSNRRTKINMEQGGFTSVCDTALVDARKGRGKKRAEYDRRRKVRALASATMVQWDKDEQAGRRVEQGAAGLYCGADLAGEEWAAFAGRTKRMAWRTPGIFFGCDVPFRLVPVAGWGVEEWVGFFSKAGFPVGVARRLAVAPLEGVGAALVEVVKAERKSRRGKVRPVNEERKERALVVLRGLERWGTSAEVGERLGVCHREAARLLGALKREGRVGLQHRRRWSPVEGA